MGPVVSKALDEDVGLWGTVPQKLFVVGESSADFSAEFRELDVCEQLPSLHDVREPTECVVEVLQGRPIL